MGPTSAASSVFWRIATCMGATVSRSSGSNVFQQPLMGCARSLALQACASTAMLPRSPTSAAIECCRWPRAAQPMQSDSHCSQVAGCGSQLSSRGYKIITQAIVDLPKITAKGHPGSKSTGVKQNPRAVSDSCNRMTRWLHEARMPEGWMRQKFYIKPKYRRNQKRWAGVLKRKRRDFNYKLRWALKSMSR